MLIKRLATRFKVNPTIIKSRLADFGWLHHTRLGQNWSKDSMVRSLCCCSGFKANATEIRCP